MAKKATVKVRDEGNRIAEARQLSKQGIKYWRVILDAQRAEGVELLQRREFVTLGVLANIASTARGAQLNRATARKIATGHERSFGSKIKALYARWRKLFKRKFRKDTTHFI